MDVVSGGLSLYQDDSGGQESDAAEFAHYYIAMMTASTHRCGGEVDLLANPRPHLGSALTLAS